MPFVIIILMRVLFAASMVFVVGYVFGGFSKNPTLAVISKVAVILAIVLFITTNILSFRFGGWRHHNGGRYECGWQQKDSAVVK